MAGMVTDRSALVYLCRRIWVSNYMALDQCLYSDQVFNIPFPTRFLFNDRRTLDDDYQFS